MPSPAIVHVRDESSALRQQAGDNHHVQEGSDKALQLWDEYDSASQSSDFSPASCPTGHCRIISHETSILWERELLTIVASVLSSTSIEVHARWMHTLARQPACQRRSVQGSLSSKEHNVRHRVVTDSADTEPGDVYKAHEAQCGDWILQTQNQECGQITAMSEIGVNKAHEARS